MVDDVAAVLTLVRKAKSEAKASMRADVESAVISASPDQAERIALASGDISAAGRIAHLSFAETSGPIAVEVTLAGG